MLTLGVIRALPYRLWTWLAYARIPGNALAFGVRQALRWSRGLPQLPHETKSDLFAYLGDEGPGETGLLPGAPGARARAEARETELRERYALEPLRARSTAALYRKNLYLLDVLESAAGGLDTPRAAGGTLRALDVGAQDWHYVFALERWLARDGGGRRPVSLRGVELDGHGVYPDLRARCDYARAYAAQTGNPEVRYEIGDFLAAQGEGLDCITWFYPFVMRHHLLLWGLPLRHFRPARLIAKAASMLRPGGWLVVLAHTREEHDAFAGLAREQGELALARAGEARSMLVDFHADVEDRRYAVFTKRPPA